MIKINSNGQTWLFVPVHDGADIFEVYEFFGRKKIRINTEKLPSGDWSIHCHSTTVTEEQAAQIVTNEGTAERPMYTDYTYPFSGYTNAIPSLATLVDAHNIATPYIVLKLKQDAPQQPTETKRKRKTKNTTK